MADAEKYESFDELKKAGSASAENRKKTALIHTNGNYTVFNEKGESLGTHNWIEHICENLIDEGLDPTEYDFEMIVNGRKVIAQPRASVLGFYYEFKPQNEE